MPDTKTTVIKQIISAAVGLDGPAMWKAIDRAANTISQDDMLRPAAQEAAAYARLACFSGDGRHLVPAIRRFRDAKRLDILDDVLDIARRFGETAAVQEVRRIGAYAGLTQLSVPDFADWFRRQGVRWFDIYEDPDKRLTFVDPQDISTLKILVAQEFPDQTGFWNTAAGEAESDQRCPAVRRALLRAIADGKQAAVPTPPDKRAEVDTSFRRYAEDNGIRILRQLACGKDGLRRCSNIYLALDADGIVKIFKEVLTHEEERVGAELDEETDIFPMLKNMEGVVPSYFGEIEIAGGTRFLVRSCIYGQSLADYVHPGQLLDKESAVAVIAWLADILASLHCRPGFRGVIYSDLRPDNVLVSQDGATLFDFNASRREPEDLYGNGEVTAYILDPKFAPPEVTLRCKASVKSDIFQLGLLFHQLLYGKLPFVTSDGLLHGDEHREQATLKFALANALLPYEHHPEKDFGDERLSIIREMLSKDPKERPDANEVTDALCPPDSDMPGSINLRRRASVNKRENNTVIFPARMGIPHRGHIDYVSRLLDLGYHVKISLQRSYTITDRDPIPKWIVMKMVARSLMDRGFDPGSFSFMLTPFFEDDLRHRLHFSMMPGREDIVAVASSNPEVPALFPGLPVIDQKAVFGRPHEEYDDKSWGEDLRKAVKTGDYENFCRYAASGVEAIMSFEELGAHYAETPVEFLDGNVLTAVLDPAGTIRMARVRAYDLPEEAAARALDATIVDPYARDTRLVTDRGDNLLLVYNSTLIEGGDETIRFETIVD